MQLGSHHRPSSRLTVRLLLLLALAVASLTLTQCQLVGDRLNGVSVAPFRRAGSCVKDCNDKANADIRAESQLHVLLVQNCGGDPVCEAQEEARHEAAVEMIQLARDACKNECHTQGAGTGGD